MRDGGSVLCLEGCQLDYFYLGKAPCTLVGSKNLDKIPLCPLAALGAKMKLQTKLSQSPNWLNSCDVTLNNQPSAASCEIFWESTWLNIRFLLPLAALLGAIADLNRRSFQSSGSYCRLHMRATRTGMYILGALHPRFVWHSELVDHVFDTNGGAFAFNVVQILGYRPNCGPGDKVLTQFTGRQHLHWQGGLAIPSLGCHTFSGISTL